MAHDPTADALTQQLQASPQFQAWLRQQTHLNPREALKSPQAQAMAAQLGIPIPPGYHVSLNGIVAKDDSVGSFLKTGALLAGGTLAAGLALPAVLGGGAATAGGGVAGGGLGTGALDAGATIPGAGMTGTIAGAGGSTLGNIGAIGRTLNGLATGRAQGRAAEAGINQNQDRIGLESARLNLMAPQQRAQNSVRGDLLANVQDVQFHRPPGVPSQGPVGGERPSILSANSRQLGSQMSRDALLSQMNGPTYTPTPVPQAGTLDHILNGVSGGAAIGEAVAPWLKKLGGLF